MEREERTVEPVPEFVSRVPKTLDFVGGSRLDRNSHMLGHASEIFVGAALGYHGLSAASNQRR